VLQNNAAVDEIKAVGGEQTKIRGGINEIMTLSRKTIETIRLGDHGLGNIYAVNIGKTFGQRLREPTDSAAKIQSGPAVWSQANGM
jgi:hypothetical protein